MKKTIFLFAAAAAVSVACQKETLETGNSTGETAMITRTLTIGQTPDSKTSYVPGDGVLWTGNETMDIYYGNSANANSGNYMQRVPSVEKNEDGTYTFSHEAIEGAEAYDYRIITPKLSTTGTGNNGHIVQIKFSPVQHPGQICRIGESGNNNEG